MRLSEILKQHFKYSQGQALKANLGDGYLLKHNSIYRTIRAEALRLGYGYTSKRFYDYDALSLTQLPRILKTKTIPYCDNVNALKEIERLAPKAFGLNEVPPLRANYLMHESAHGVARSLKPKFKETLNEKVLSALLEESFANVCECLSNLDSTTELHDEFLYKNSYILEKPVDRKTLFAVDQIMGRSALFRLMLIAYLHSNMIKTRDVIENFDPRILRIVYHDQKPKKFTQTEMNKIKLAFKIGLNLDPGFTHFTNAFCFRLMGVRKNIYELLEFDFLEILLKKSAYQKWIDKLGRVLFVTEC